MQAAGMRRVVGPKLTAASGAQPQRSNGSRAAPPAQLTSTICSPSKSGTSSGNSASSYMPLPRRPPCALPQLHSNMRGGGGAAKRALPCGNPRSARRWCTKICLDREPLQGGHVMLRVPASPPLPRLPRLPHLWHMVSCARPTPCASNALVRSLTSSVTRTECTRPAAISACLQARKRQVWLASIMYGRAESRDASPHWEGWQGRPHRPSVHHTTQPAIVAPTDSHTSVLALAHACMHAWPPSLHLLVGMP